MATIAVLWLGFSAIAFWPASWWLRIDNLTILDGKVGVSPVVVVDRTIRREFRAQWVVTVLRQGRSGFYAFCTGRGENDYQPTTVLPDVVDLRWWTESERCDLPAGTYYVRTLWTIYPAGLPAKTIRAQSNVFRISEE